MIGVVLTGITKSGLVMRIVILVQVGTPVIARQKRFFQIMMLLSVGLRRMDTVKNTDCNSILFGMQLCFGLRTAGNDMESKKPPHNTQIERSLLGMILLSEEVIPSVIARLEPRDFYNPHHREIYTEINTLFNSGKSVDIITIANGLKDRGVIESIGGIPYLSSMTDIVASWSSVPDYCRIVKDKCKARDLIKLSTEATVRCHSNECITTIINDLGGKFFAISADKTKEAKGVGNIVDKVFTEIEERCNSDSNIAGLETGFTQLDKILSGLQQTDLIILAGRPSMGKTALVMNICRYIGMQEKNILVFSLEMNKERLVKRMLSDISMVNYNAILNGHLNDSTWPKIIQARGVIESMPIMIDDSPGLSIVELRARAKMASIRHGVELIVVDYMQLMHDKADNREREIAQISLGLKNLAKELDIPVVALAQLNRSLENRPDKRPIMSDLRDSGSIEQDADVIIFTYRDEVYNKSSDNPLKGIAELIIAKQRNGPTGKVKLAFLGQFLRFENLAEREDNGW